MPAAEAVRTVRHVLLGCMLLVWWACLPRAVRAQATVPLELQPWVPWVLEKHPAHGCIPANAKDPCVWAGRLDVEVSSSTGLFRMRVQVDRDAWVTLPGGAGQWPVDVWTNVGPLTVSDHQGYPRVWLPTGTHTINGRFVWDALPQLLRLPKESGLISLAVNGQRVDGPRIDADGRLQLDTTDDRSGTEGDALEIDVTRHITDGVPVRVRTRIDLRVAGGARELPLGEVLLDGTVPVAVDSKLPVQIGDGQKRVSVQVRPGTWSIAIDALAEGPVTELLAPSGTIDAWPEAEFWSIATSDDVRSVTLTGGVGVDPGRTPIPSEYHVHPAYVLQQGDTLAFEEMRRGVPAPPPSAMTVHRSIWVDADGKGVTTQDRITGQMEQGWRLNVTPPLALGHVAIDGTDRVVTTDARGTGVVIVGGFANKGDSPEDSSVANPLQRRADI